MFIFFPNITWYRLYIIFNIVSREDSYSNASILKILFKKFEVHPRNIFRFWETPSAWNWSSLRSSLQVQYTSFRNICRCFVHSCIVIAMDSTIHFMRRALIHWFYIFSFFKLKRSLVSQRKLFASFCFSSSAVQIDWVTSRRSYLKCS